MQWRQLIPAAILLASPAFAAQAQVSGRLIDGVESSERPGHTDISVVFGCGLRYVSHTPASEGDSLRVRLVPLGDCGGAVASGSFAAPPSLGDARELRSVDVETLAGSDLFVTFNFATREHYVLAPTADSHGLRIRLLRPESNRSRIIVFDKNGPPATYAVNLAAAEQPFAAEDIARAREVTGAAAYVSEYQLGDRTWYRLRAGPFDTESAARKVLLIARTTWPKAWLAVGDDAVLNSPAEPEGTESVLPTLPGHPSTLTAQDAEALYLQARKAVARRDYGNAIQMLTRLLEQPEFPRRTDSQELMGLARERSGQLAHAKAEYQEYLRRYPDGPGTKRVRERLRVLALAARRSINGGTAADETPWRSYGGASQIYRRDDTQLKNDAFSTSLTSQNALISSFDVVARRRGERFDFSARAGAGHIKDMTTEGPGDQTRVDAAFVEVGDRELDWSARLGRQSRTAGGLFGTFDGLYAGYQLLPRLRLNSAVGFPVETTRDSLDSGRQFLGLALDLGTFASSFDFTLYGVSQRLDAGTDRQAFGTELRYFRPGRTAVALVDYDLHFHELNNAVLLASVELPRRWSLSGNLDWRKSPSLSLRNALIGQQVTSFDELLNLFARSELERLARDRSADSRLYSVSLGRAVGEHWQWSLDYSAISTGETPSSGGVDAVPATGTDNAVTLQGIAAGLFGGTDFSTLALRHQTGTSLDIDSIGIATRLPLGRLLRIGPRLRVDRRNILTDGSREMLYAPSLRLDLQHRRALLECELGAELGRRALEGARSNTTRYYFSLGYRLNF